MNAGNAGESGAHEYQHEIQCGGVRFGGEWQGVEQLTRQAGGPENRPGQIDVRERLMDHEGGALERRQSPVPKCSLCASRKGHNFFFAIAGKVNAARLIGH
jgi:hypothetical protein